MSIDTFLLSSNTTDLNYPEIRPTLDLNFARVKALDPRITFTRASGGSYVGADGLIKLAGVNEARFDHDPVTGESLGFLVEEARTNSTRNSTDLSPSSFYAGAGGQPYTFSTNQTTSPDGAITAGSILFTGIECGFVIQNTGVTAATITVSLFAKYITGSVNTHVRIQLSPGGGGDNYGLFNLTTGAFSTSGSVSSVTMTPFPNGWYRCSVTATHSTTWPQNSGDIRFWFHGATATQAPINNTDRTYVWGVQLEAGAFPTSYIPTEGSTRTRAADVASMTGTNFSSWYRQDEVSCFISGRLSAAENYLFSFSADSGANRILSDPATYALYVSAGGVDSAQISSTVPANTNFKFVIAAKQNSFNLANAGVLGTLDTSGAMPTVINKLNLFTAGGGSEGSSGTISRLTYYPKRLTDAQLQVLTR